MQKKDSNNLKAVRSYRRRRASEGYKYIQVYLDSETLEILRQLKTKLYAKRRTGMLIKKALQLLYKQTMNI